MIGFIGRYWQDVEEVVVGKIKRGLYSLYSDVYGNELFIYTHVYMYEFIRNWGT